MGGGKMCGNTTDSKKAKQQNLSGQPPATAALDGMWEASEVSQIKIGRIVIRPEMHCKLITKNAGKTRIIGSG